LELKNMPALQYSIETRNLGRIYKIRGAKKEESKTLVALRDINLSVKPGELFGLLGPNGAGKTTLIKILTTLLSPSSGTAFVAGIDAEKDPGKVRQVINMVSGGESSGYGLLTVRENLWMFAQFYGIPTEEANTRIKTLLEIVGLADRMNTRSSDLSTGLRQKMNIVRGFLTDPRVLFLDEPTLGLDVGASRDVRHFVRQWVDEDPTRTLLLTTHYMVEADEMCDRVAIINQGKVLACDTPSALKQQLQKNALFEIKVDSPAPLNKNPIIKTVGVQNCSITEVDGGSHIELNLAEEAHLANVIVNLTAQNARILSLQKHEPTLEDVFVKLTGLSMEEVENVADDDPTS
jgi:ABC-2 type transport system ATP-binding protein